MGMRNKTVIITGASSGIGEAAAMQFASEGANVVLKAQGGWALVFTGSFVGVSNGGMPGMGAYAASKAGLIGLVQSLTSDLAADGVRVNAPLPSGTRTAMAGEDPEIHSFIAGLHPMKRMAAPAEIAQAALFLLSDRASFMTGASMAVDGGRWRDWRAAGLGAQGAKTKKAPRRYRGAVRSSNRERCQPKILVKALSTASQI